MSSVQLASKKFKFYQELYTEIRIKAVPTRLACHATKESHCAVRCTVFPNLSWSFCRVLLHLVCTCSCLFTALRLTAELRSHTPGRSSAMELEVGSWQKPPKMPMIGFYPSLRPSLHLQTLPLPSTLPSPTIKVINMRPQSQCHRPLHTESQVYQGDQSINLMPYYIN